MTRNEAEKLKAQHDHKLKEYSGHQIMHIFIVPERPPYSRALLKALLMKEPVDTSKDTDFGVYVVYNIRTEKDKVIFEFVTIEEALQQKAHNQ